MINLTLSLSESLGLRNIASSAPAVRTGALSAAEKRAVAKLEDALEKACGEFRQRLTVRRPKRTTDRA